MDEKATIIHDKTNDTVAGVIELTGKINSDLTGKLPFKYFRGRRYIMVMYDYDSNTILAESMNIVRGNQLSMHMKHYTTS